ncbi:Gti1/Pac2 family-domain-containing protein [Schizophyllum amplum]|uniref:Gti1/Pac2 family-domain-containing protein n=1 Tax=Schizophyllum amplum TaxID=97359 RepID=A0A550CZP1_9AGAR|nr:Gti1/Pac2 family-domain-containing protein [Auriculariopsis ampla]
MALDLQAQPPLATCRGVFLRNEKDAKIVLYAVCAGALPKIHRRLDDTGRQAIRAGDVYAFEPKSAVAEPNGIERWTDGISWYPSKNKDYFLYYDEKPRELLPPGFGQRHYHLLKRTYTADVALGPGLPPRKFNLVWYAAKDDAHNRGLVHVLSASDLCAVFARLPRDIDKLCTSKRDVHRSHNDRRPRDQRRIARGSDGRTIDKEEAFAGPVLLSHATGPSIATIAPGQLPSHVNIAQTTPGRWRGPGALPPPLPATFAPEWVGEESVFTRREARGSFADTQAPRRPPTPPMGVPGLSHRPVPHHQPPGLVRPSSSSSSSSSSGPSTDMDEVLPEDVRSRWLPRRRSPLLGTYGDVAGGGADSDAAVSTFSVPPLNSPSRFGESGAMLPDVQDMPIMDHYIKRSECDDRMLLQLEKNFHI